MIDIMDSITETVRMSIEVKEITKEEVLKKEEGKEKKRKERKGSLILSL